MSEYKQGFINIAETLCKQLHQMESTDFFSMVANCDSIRNCLCELYWMQVKEGSCVKLEDLPKEEKAALWSEAQRLCTDPTQKKLINTCKAIHSIGNYLQTKF